VQHHQVADVDRLLESHRVHDYGDQPLSRVPRRCRSAGGIGELHQRAAVDVARGIGILGQHHLREGDLARRSRVSGLGGRFRSRRGQDESVAVDSLLAADPRSLPLIFENLDRPAQDWIIALSNHGWIGLDHFIRHNPDAIELLAV
jgi:hypothetical protein